MWPYRSIDLNEENSEEIIEKPKYKAIIIIGLICVIGLIIYLTFVYGIMIPTVFDKYLG